MNPKLNASVTHSGQPPHLPAARLPDLDMDLNSPAILGMMDFSNEQPLRVSLRIGAETARQLFEASHACSMLVENADGDLQGVLSRADVFDSKALSLASRSRQAFSELEVGELMTPLARIGRIGLRETCQASLGEVLATMEALGERLLLVMGGQQDPETVCGLFSTERLSRLLHRDVTSSWRAGSFADLEQRLVPVDLE